MMGTVGATWLIILLLAFTGVVGLLVGLLTSLIIRQQWTGRVAAADAALSVISAMVIGYTIGSVEIARGNWHSDNWLIMLLAAAVVVLKHGLPFAFSRKKIS